MDRIHIEKAVEIFEATVQDSDPSMSPLANGRIVLPVLNRLVGNALISLHFQYELRLSDTGKTRKVPRTHNPRSLAK